MVNRFEAVIILVAIAVIAGTILVPELITPILSAAFIVVTLFYAHSTQRITSESEEAREAQSRPVVYLGVEEIDSPMILELFATNTGRGVAYDVKFEVVKDFTLKTNGNRQLSDLGIINHPITMLGLEQKIPVAVIDPRDYENLFKETFEVKSIYKAKSNAGEAFEQSFVIDFTYFEGLSHVRTRQAESQNKPT